MTNSTELFARANLYLIKAPGPDTITSPSLTANFLIRVILGIFANIVCLVPLKHLYRNGEFAATVFIINIEIKNLDTIVNAIIWRNDDVDSWWAGYGLCDVTPYIRNFTIVLFCTCLLAIMRNLAQQVGLMRANPLTVREKRKRNLVQGLIMFPLPILQMAWVWPLTAQRYVIGTLVGCSWISYPAWPYVIFFILVPVIVSLITTGYAVLTYIRFREVAKTTRSALSGNRLAALRAQRTKRRLYLMVVSILAPFLPLVITLAVVNLMDSAPLKPFDYKAIHEYSFPFPWNTIVYLPSNNIGFAYMNIGYISILSALPVFIFFGMTKDAMNSYRRGLLMFGLGIIFPRLYQEYDPDRDAYADSSYGSRFMGSISSSVPSGKWRSFLSSRQMSTVSMPRNSTTQPPQVRSSSFALTSIDAEEGHRGQHRSNSLATVHPLPEEPSTTIDLPHRNPFLFRTNLNLHFPIPLKLPSFKSKPKPTQQPYQDRPLPLDSLPSIQHPHWERHHDPEPSRIHTRVWSEDEVGLVADCPPEARASPDLAAVLVETQLTRETHRR